MTVFFHLFIGILLVGATALAVAGDTPSSSGPPKAKVSPVEDTVQGHKIVDPYRYLENQRGPETVLFVERSSAIPRSSSTRFPGREKINARLTSSLRSAPSWNSQIGGKYYFHTRREGDQNQPLLYVRERLNGEDRVLLDLEQTFG